MKQLLQIKTLCSLCAACGAVALLAGCGAPPAASGGAAATAPQAKPYKLDFGGADVGIPVAQSGDVKQYQEWLADLNVHTRMDPFALSGAERSFDRSQFAEYLTQQDGNMAPDFYVKPDVEPPPPPEEPQPYRRVSGIIVADSVVAIIDMGDGKGGQIVRPGMYVPNTEWKVVSITEDEVVLRRAGNVRPKEVHVHLEELPPEMRRDNAPAASGPKTGGGGNAPPSGKGSLGHAGA